MKPNIFVVGPSGTGKSSSLRNLNPETTIVLNTEQKALPFRGAGKFKLNVPIPDMNSFHVAFDKAIASTKANVIIIESFTSLVEHLYRYSNSMYSGFDVWNNYKEEVGAILNKSKGTDKYVIFTGIDETIDGPNGVDQRIISVEGKAWKGKVEKEFVILLFSNVSAKDGGGITHEFITNRIEGFEKYPCKSPMEMLPPKMPNDLAEVIKYAEAYENGEEVPQKVETPTEKA